MTGLLAAEIAAERAHFFDDMAVPDLGAVQLDTVAGEKTLETEIGHDRGDQSTACEPSAPRQSGRDQRHQLVAVENDAALVGDDQSVGIAIERNPDIRAPRQNLAPHLFGRQRTAFAVYVEAVGRDAEREDFGAELPEYRRGDLVAGAVCAIDDDAQPVQPQSAGKALFDEFDIAAARIVEPLHAPELRRARPPARSFVEAGFDLLLEFVRQLVPVAAEQFDAVIPIRVVRGRKNDAEIGPQAARQHGDRRGRERADQHDVHAHRDKAGGQRGFEHVTGEPGVLADDDEMLVGPVLKAFADRHRHL